MAQEYYEELTHLLIPRLQSKEDQNLLQEVLRWFGEGGGSLVEAKLRERLEEMGSGGG